MEVLEIPVNSARNTRFRQLYEDCFPAVAVFVSKMNGTLEDAKDIFHDALVIYHEKNSGHTFHVTVSEEAYIVGICKHLWIRKFNADRKKIYLSDFENSISIPEDYFPSVSTTRLMLFLEHTGKKCFELLSAFYYEHLTAKELLARFGYKTEHSASVQKYKCIEKVRETIKQKSLNYEDFLE
jgi:DNA-directed RNA polymerase specialized sigma24 family protein